MADLNHVVLIGRLTRDAELKYTANGQAVCKFSIAVNRRRKSGDQWVDEANFFDIVLWGRQGESLNQYLLKGKMVGVDGELRQDRWEQDGQNRSKVEIVANNLQLLGGSPGAGGAKSVDGSGSYGSGGSSGGANGSSYGANDSGGGSYGGQNKPREAPSSREGSDDNFTDDIPF
jgi:single-strand DNA-binding protein